jgi:hypothetical protein
MNTGSEYAATRQVAFAGDRVLAVFDAGSAPYQGNQPMSNYRVVSLDLRTGAKRNELNFTGHWGAMPFIYATEDGHVDMQSNPPQTLNPDLSLVSSPIATEPTNADHPNSGKDAGGNFDPWRWPLTKQRTLNIENNALRITDPDGKSLAQRPPVEYGGFAGASRDGSRFAIDSSDSEGDPSFLIYEHLIVYDGNTAAPLAMVPIKNLPERQSWSALSPDGKYFVVGNPNDLSMYQLP